jgi:hydroxypyruvate isomerase
MDRRQMMGAFAALPLALGSARAFAKEQRVKGQFKQGVCDAVFGDKMPNFEDRCKLAQACGAKGYDFVADPANFAIAKKYGLQLTILAPVLDGKNVLRPQPMPPGWHAAGTKEAQGAYLQGVKQAIDVAAANGCPNVLIQCGSRRQVTSAEGADNTVEFLNKVKDQAEAKGVTICIENLNSLGIQSPPQSLFDKAEWGWDISKRVNSKSVKILFDIYHDALMEGNVSQKIRDNIQWIGHMHTGSIGAKLPPGRYELWRNNELDYRFIAQVIAETGYTGFVSHEWHPSPDSDVKEDLRKSIQLMAV